MSKRGLVPGRLAAAIVALASALALPAMAAELIMFDDKGCPYCRRWLAEIGPGYPNTTEGQRAPLRRIDIRAKLPDDIALSRPVTTTPTFVVIDNGREVGRVIGYAGAEFFYEMLGDQLAKLPASKSETGDAKKAGQSQ